MGQYFDILKPLPGITIPLVVHIPHSSTQIPEAFRAQFTLSALHLETELIAMTDRYTDELFDTTTRLGGSMLVNQASRLVMDPERFPDDDDEPMSKKGMGVVYTHTSDGRKLRDENFDSQQREELMIKLF